MDQAHSIPHTVASRHHIQEDVSPQNAEKLPQTMTSSNTDSPEEGSVPLDVPQPQAKSGHTLTDWDGPADVGNPRNWPMSLRVYGVFVPAWYSFAV
jgi:hypothetical protein